LLIRARLLEDLFELRLQLLMAFAHGFAERLDLGLARVRYAGVTLLLALGFGRAHSVVLGLGFFLGRLGQGGQTSVHFVCFLGIVIAAFHEEFVGRRAVVRSTGVVGTARRWTTVAAFGHIDALGNKALFELFAGLVEDGFHAIVLAT